MSVTGHVASWGFTRPPVGPTINWGHPLAQGLVLCNVFTENSGRPIELVQGVSLALQTNASWRGAGLFSGASNPNGAFGAINTSRMPTTEATVAWRGVFLGDGSSNAALYGTGTTTNPYVGVQLQRGAAGSQNSIIGAFAESTNQRTFSASVNLTNRYKVELQFAATIKSGNQQIFDGPTRVGTPGTTSYSAFAYPGSTHNVEVGTITVFPARYTNAINLLGCVWNRILPDSQIAWLDSDPYCFLMPR